MALSLRLKIEAQFTPIPPQPKKTQSKKLLEKMIANWSIIYEGDSAETVLLDPRKNLITLTAAQVIVRHVGIERLPKELKVHVNNPIPLGRGLGSSGAAVVGGVLLGNVLAELNLDLQACLDECLRIEHHPDNITAALAGGWVACWANEKLGKGGYIHLPIHKDIIAVTVSPRFEVKTIDARNVLPKHYKLEDVVFNLQRITQLTVALGAEKLDPEMIHFAMQDRIHQPYRQTLIPGVQELLYKLTPSSDNGLLGVCISGSGPTVLALVHRNANAQAIATKIQNIFLKKGIESDARILEIERQGAHYEVEDCL
jgi:homoserine kinase